MSMKSWVRVKNWIKSFCVGDGLVQNSRVKEFNDEWLEGVSPGQEEGMDGCRKWFGGLTEV